MAGSDACSSVLNAQANEQCAGRQLKQGQQADSNFRCQNHLACAALQPRSLQAQQREQLIQPTEHAELRAQHQPMD